MRVHRKDAKDAKKMNRYDAANATGFPRMAELYLRFKNVALVAS
jgi:hypothetical protein